MSHRPFKQQEWTQLIGDLLDGRLDEDSARRLESVLCEDAEARRYYLRYVGLCVGLKYSIPPEFTEQPLTAAQPEAPTPPLKADGMRSPLLGFLGNILGTGTQYLTQRLNRDLPFSLLFAVVIPLAMLIFVAVTLFSEHVEVRIISTRTSLVAKLTRTFDCRWTGDSSNISIGQSIDAKMPLDLETGLAEIVTAEGAHIIVEGPARIQFQDSKRFLLQYGKVVVDVPEQAIGFTVQTPHTTVVDLGTNFGIAVEEGTQSSVCVFQGEVEVEASQAFHGNTQGRLVRAGFGVRVTNDAKMMEVKPVEQMAVQLVREMPKSRRLVFRNGLEGYEGTQATFIRSCVTGTSPDVSRASLDETEKNFGNTARLFTSGMPPQSKPPECARTLIEFKDIVGNQPGRIPAGAKILSAILRLHTINEEFAGEDKGETVSMHEVLVPWSEGRVTWKNFNKGGTAGVDFNSAAVASICPAKVNTFYEMNVTDSMKRWANGSANHGWIMLESMNRVHYDSDESQTVVFRPALAVEYTLADDEEKMKKGKQP